MANFNVKLEKRKWDNHKYQLRYNYAPGKRTSIVIGHIPKDNAQKLRKRAEDLLSEGKDPKQYLFVETGENYIPFSSLCESHCLRQKEMGVRDIWRKEVLRIINTLLIPFFGADTDITQLDRKKIVEYRDTRLQTPNQRTGNPLAKRTVQKEMAIINAIFNHAVKEGYIIKSPVFDVPVRIGHKQQKPLSLKTIEKLLALLPSEARIHFTVKFYTGLSWGEQRRLRWKDVDFDNDQLKIAPKTSDDVEVIPLHPKAKVALLEMKSLLHQKGESVESSDLIFTVEHKKAWSTALKKLGIKALKPHYLRHSLVQALYKDGIAPEVAQQILRHKKMETTLKHYLELNGDAKQALLKLGSHDNKWLNSGSEISEAEKKHST